MMHKLRKAEGIRFLTRGTICTDDIIVVPELQTLEVDQRGIYTADEGYVGIGEINVNIPEATTEEAEVTPNTDTQYVTPKGADYLSKVTVKPIPSTYVPEGYVPQPVFQEKTVTDYSAEVTPDEGFDGLSKVIVAVTEPVFKSKTITGNGTYNAADDGADGYSSIIVDVPNSGGSETSLYKFNNPLVKTNVPNPPAEEGDEGLDAAGVMMAHLGKVIKIKVTEGDFPVNVYIMPFGNESMFFVYYYIEGEDKPQFVTNDWILYNLPFEIIEINGYDEWLNANATLVSGGGGTCSGKHIIEVNELPTENVDDSTFYLCNGVLYQRPHVEFVDLVCNMEIFGVMSLSSAAFLEGIVFTVNIIPEPTSEGILTSYLPDSNSNDDPIWHIYYIESEESTFVYAGEDRGWVPTSDASVLAMPYKGIVSDISEVPTDEEAHYAVIRTVWDEYHEGELIVKVNELPTEDINNNALYKCTDGYYKHGSQFIDIIMVADDGTAVPFSLLLAILDAEYSYNAIPTKTTDGILASDSDTNIYHIYYIADEPDALFMYQNGAWKSFCELMAEGELMSLAANASVITLTDIDSDTGANIASLAESDVDHICMYVGVAQSYAECVLPGFYAYGDIGWTKYTKPVGGITVTKNDRYDVGGLKFVDVQIPAQPKSYSLPMTLNELPEDALRGSLAFVFGGE